jgi:hypothetical protein
MSRRPKAWEHHKINTYFQPIIIETEKRILTYNPNNFFVRIAGTAKDPQLYIYALTNP